MTRTEIFLHTMVVMLLLTLLLALHQVQSQPCLTVPDPGSLYCRDSWVANLTYDDFSVYTCSKCYVQVFWAEKELTLVFPPEYPYYLFNMSDINATGFYPDAEVVSSEVCQRTLSTEECTMWRQCCQAAKTCCQQNLYQDITTEADVLCPATWDGVSCWKETPGGETRLQSCPDYYAQEHIAWTSPKASRHCGANGTWTVNIDTGQEFTDYNQCFDSQPNTNILQVSLYIDFVGNGISIIFLVTAIIVILGFRNLRLELQQKAGLKIHFNLFVAVLCAATFTVAFHSIYHDAFTSANPVYHHNAIWCRALNILTKYFKSVTYMCMFCEGLYLYRRISQVMQIGVKETLLKYVLIGWVLPLVTMTVYVIVRLALGHNERCWIDDNGLSNLEYIHMLPNLGSLMCNLVFLISIEYMLCTKMRGDLSNRRVEVLRHAIRATMSLIPIFGLQFLFLIYRPQHWPPYEIIVAIFQSTQGMLVAILYCFTTTEVKTQLTSQFQSCRGPSHRARSAASPCNGAFRSVNQPVPARSRTTSRQNNDRVSHRMQKQNGSNIAHVILPDVVDVHLEPERRDSNVSKTTQKSFLTNSETSLNSHKYKRDGFIGKSPPATSEHLSAHNVIVELELQPLEHVENGVLLNSSQLNRHSAFCSDSEGTKITEPLLDNKNKVSELSIRPAEEALSENASSSLLYPIFEMD